jgi:pimeloyl-ACP methyl ester carboxylesterase
MFPERLAGLGLFHSHPFADTPERIENRRRGIAMLESGKKDLYVAQMFPNLFAPAFAAAHPEIVDAMIMRGRQQPAEGIIDALNGMIDRLDHTHTLQSVDCPVLFVLGSEDALIPYEEGLRAALLPDISSIRLLNHIGHMGMLETPELFAAIVSDFYHFATRS